MSLPRAFSGDTYNTSVRSCNSPARALRTRRSMHARNAASVLPEPVGAEIKVVRPARMCGHPCSCGSVGVPNFAVNHSAPRGWGQEGAADITVFYSSWQVLRKLFALLPEGGIAFGAFCFLPSLPPSAKLNQPMGRIHVLPEHVANKI